LDRGHLLALRYDMDHDQRALLRLDCRADRRLRRAIQPDCLSHGAGGSRLHHRRSFDHGHRGDVRFQAHRFWRSRRHIRDPGGCGFIDRRQGNKGTQGDRREQVGDAADAGFAGDLQEPSLRAVDPGLSHRQRRLRPDQNSIGLFPYLPDANGSSGAHRHASAVGIRGALPLPLEVPG